MKCCRVWPIVPGYPVGRRRCGLCGSRPIPATKAEFERYVDREAPCECDGCNKARADKGRP